MAGYAYGLDEGGAIPDDEQGAPPVESDANNGEVSPGFTPPPEDDTSGAAPPANAKRIIQYLMGAGAAHPDVADKFSTAVKAEHPGTSDDDANLISILKAKQKGGDEAASALLQSHMQQYAAKNAFAHAALSGGAGGQQQPEAAQQPSQEQGLPDVGERPIATLGAKIAHDVGEGWENFKNSGPAKLVQRAINTPGGDLHAPQNKGPDPHAAAEAATLASQHMLDGSHTKFVANPDGDFTAAVKDANNVHQSFNLTPQQFAEWTRPGGAGQWDQVLATGGVAPALAKLTSSQDNGQSDDQNSAGQSAGQSAGHEELRYQPPQGGGAKAAPAQSDDDSDDAKENARLDAQSRKIFPWMSQERQRQAWIAQQQSHAADNQNKIDVENARGTFRVQTEGEKNKGRIGAATIRGNAQVEAAKQRAVADVARQAAISGREDDRRRAKIFTTLVNSSNIASQADIDKAAKAAGITLGGASMQPMVGAQLTQSPAQGTAPATGKRSFTAANVPPAEQRQVGDVVQTSKGMFQWTGSSWQHQ